MRKAVILAAGRGTRMKHLTDDLPKPMLLLRGRPILDHICERLGKAGIDRYAMVTGYRAETIEEYFTGRADFFRQETTNGTAKATLLAREFVGADDFLMTFGDILAESVDYAAMAHILNSDGAASAVAAVRWVDDPWQGAAVYEENGTVTRIVEKPVQGTSQTHWNSAGIYCFRASVFDELAQVTLSSRGEYELTSAVEKLVERGGVRMHALTGVWRDIGRPEDLEAAQCEV